MFLKSLKYNKSKSFYDTLDNLTISINLSMSGLASSLSHLLTVCLEVLTISSNSSCDIFHFFLKLQSISPNIESTLEANIIQI